LPPARRDKQEKTTSIEHFFGGGLGFENFYLDIRQRYYFFSHYGNLHVLGVSRLGVSQNTPKSTPKFHGFERITMDVDGQQKTRFLRKEAGLMDNGGCCRNI